MKISFSLSSSSSSSSTFDGNMADSDTQNATIAGCLFGILRRFLCTGGHPTHPSDHIKEPTDRVECDEKIPEKIEAPATPGLVARLMGLESMPEINWVPTGRTPDSIGRSRSVNSADYSSNFDPMQGLHRRVRASLSFREVPTFLQIENEDFFLLSLENDGESKEFESRGRKSDMGIGELKQRRAERSKDKENRRERVAEKNQKKKREVQQSNNRRVCNQNEKPKRRNFERPPQQVEETKDLGSVPPHKRAIYRKPRAVSKSENPVKPTNHKEKKKTSRASTKKVEHECNPQNSSPVSVLDLGDSLIDPETPLSEEEQRPRGLNSRRKLSPELANSENPFPHFSRNSISDDQESISIDRKGTESEKRDGCTKNYQQLWEEICRVAEEDLKESNWVSRELSRMQDFEEISVEFELEILDKLVHEVLTELTELLVQNSTM